jgi:hypothetical protein
LTISLQDVNDNYPVFKDDYRPVVQENSKPNQLVVTIFAKDPDNSENGPPFKFAEPSSTPTRNDFSMKFIQGMYHD